MSAQFTSFADVHRRLETWPAGDKRHRYSLEHMHQLFEALGNPQRRLRVIHVAGTSGKTSTAYYAAALLQAAGKRVGLTVSPHVYEINERVQINLTPLPEAEFAQRFAQFLQLVERSGVAPNYFELFASFALWEFAARQVDYAVVEVGIGGLMDSTNIFEQPDKVCIITDIGFDHTKVLGNSLDEIAAQKAGIIQLHNAVFCYLQGGAVNATIRQAAAQKQADLHTLTRADQASSFNFLPQFQQRNFGLSLAATSYVLERDGVPLPSEAIEKAAHTFVPARMEVRELGNKTVVLDVAHNPQKLEGILESVRARFGDRPIAALVRLPARDATSQRMVNSLKVLKQHVQHLIVTSSGPEDQWFRPEALAAAGKQLGFASLEVIASPQQAFGVLQVRPEPLALVAGFALVSQLAPLLPRR
jgi:dihydrofolate synthase / folylpolyglutamate synthase